MPQARLPDVNTAFITYRRHVLQCLNRDEYDDCIGSIIAMNSLLPKEYRISISTQDYTAKMSIETTAYCTKCDHPHNYKDINKFDLVLPEFEAIVTKQKTAKAWICTQKTCRATNRLSLTKIRKSIPEETDHIQTVEKPPQRKSGIRERNKYVQKVRGWIWNAVEEVEERAAQFRDDNWHKANEMMPDEDVDTDNDEK